MKRTTKNSSATIHKGIEALERIVRAKARDSDPLTSKRLDWCLTAFLNLFAILFSFIDE